MLLRLFERVSFGVVSGRCRFGSKVDLTVVNSKRRPSLKLARCYLRRSISNLTEQARHSFPKRVAMWRSFSAFATAA